MTGMTNLRTGARTPHSLDVNSNRYAASSQEEDQKRDEISERSTLPPPNRVPHERMQLQRMQQMLNKNSGTGSTLLTASSSQREQAAKNNEQGEATSTSGPKNDSQAESSYSGIWRMAEALSKFLPWNWMKMSPREELQTNLIKIKKHFETLREKKWSPDNREFYCDVALLPIAVKAENAREPGLNLHDFDSFHSFAEAVKSGKLQNGRAIFQLQSNNGHAVAADIRTIDDKISILVLDPVNLVLDPLKIDDEEAREKRYSKTHVSAMLDALPENAKLTVLSVDVQKADSGCRIFALSAASKLAKNSEFFDGIHESHANDKTQVFKKINKSDIQNRLRNAQLSDDPIDVYVSPTRPNFRFINAHRLVPASFQKHTQSKSSLKAWADEDKLAQTKVNKKDETLLSRFNRRIVTRYKRDFLTNERGAFLQWNGMKQLNFSASIEEKRLTYLERAITYLDNAPQEEISDFLHRLYQAQAEYELPELFADAVTARAVEMEIAATQVGPRNMPDRPELNL